MHPTLFHLTACAVLATASLVHAAEGPAVTKAGPATLDRSVSSASGVELTAGQGGGEARIKASFPIDGPFHLAESLSLTASAPLNKDGDSPTELATLDSLAGSSALELKYTAVALTEQRNPTPAQMTDFCDRLTKVYTDVGVAKTDFDRGECDEGHVDSLIDRVGLRERAGLLGDREATAARRTLASMKDEYRDLQFGRNSSVFIGGAKIRAGYEKFDYFDAATLAAKSSDETSWSAGFFVAVQPGTLPALFTFSYDHQDSFKAAKKATLCPVGPGPGPVVCASGAIGAPKAVTSDLLAVEARFKSAHLPIGLAVTATYDAQAETWGIDVPIYLIGDEKKALSGGVRLGWREDTDETTASVFVAKAFNLFD